MSSPPPLLRYSLLGIPLAFAGLPIYVHIPHIYATNFGMNLALVGVILLAVRFIDAFQDPLIGVLSDRTRTSRRTIILAAALPLMLGFVGLFNPPALIQASGWLAGWLAAMLLVVYTAFSVMMINYYAAGMAYGEAAQTRVSAFREGGILVGVILAAILPSLLMQGVGLSEMQSYHWFSLAFLPLTLVCLAIAVPVLGDSVTPKTLIGRPVPNKDGNPDHTKEWMPASAGMTTSQNTAAKMSILRHRPIRQMLLLFFLNSIPTAITSTLFLFYVEDVLHAKDTAGYLLLAYFAAAALSVAGWTWVAGRIGHKAALALGMVLAIASFIWAYGLGAGDVGAFTIICIFSGIAVGADATLLPALFARALEPFREQSAFAYSLWHFISKFNLSLAAGLVLPALAWLGYAPSATTTTPSDHHALLIAYAIIPCGIKILALIALLRFPSSKP
jgi:glycoside/pentoside/hexuronide:cation symporter, GPH family